jgi:hypothetical protein
MRDYWSQLPPPQRLALAGILVALFSVGMIVTGLGYALRTESTFPRWPAVTCLTIGLGALAASVIVVLVWGWLSSRER